MARTTGGMIGSLKPDNLIAHISPAPEVFVIDLKESGLIERGTVMSMESDGTYAVMGTGTGKASCIIADTTEEDDVTAIAYRTGHFYRNGLILSSTTETTGEGEDAETTVTEYELTAEDENDLRLAGILLSDGI